MTDRAVKRIGRKLRVERESRGYTQEYVAGKAGITRNYYALIERGLKNPSTTVFSDIIDALGIKSADILGK